jgi:hypothetical protein
LTGISRLRRIDYTRNQRALGKWVSGVTLVTFAYGIVIGNLAFGIYTTGARARILALRVDTGLVLRAVKTQKALWLAAEERISLVVSDTLADSLPTLLPALGIHTARTGIARVLWFGRLRNHWLLRAPRKWISYSAWWTAAYGIVILDFAHSKHPAGAGTGVYALLSYAGKRSGAVRVLQALSPAALVRGRVSLVSSPAAAHYLPRPVLCTLCVWPAW